MIDFGWIKAMPQINFPPALGYSLWLQNGWGSFQLDPLTNIRYVGFLGGFSLVLLGVLGLGFSSQT